MLLGNVLFSLQPVQISSDSTQHRLVELLNVAIPDLDLVQTVLPDSCHLEVPHRTSGHDHQDGKKRLAHETSYCPCCYC